MTFKIISQFQLVTSLLWYHTIVQSKGSSYLILKRQCGTGAVAHAYNPSYSGNGDREDHDSRAAQAKSLKDPISINKPGMVAGICDLWYTGSRR
jgi:hypothetical protein